MGYVTVAHQQQQGSDARSDASAPQLLTSSTVTHHQLLSSLTPHHHPPPHPSPASTGNPTFDPSPHSFWLSLAGSAQLRLSRLLGDWGVLLARLRAASKRAPSSPQVAPGSNQTSRPKSAHRQMRIYILLGGQRVPFLDCFSSGFGPFPLSQCDPKQLKQLNWGVPDKIQ